MSEAVSNVVAWVKGHPVLAGGMVIGAAGLGYLLSRSMKDGQAGPQDVIEGSAGGAGIGEDQSILQPFPDFPPPESGIVIDSPNIGSGGPTTTFSTVIPARLSILSGGKVGVFSKGIKPPSVFSTVSATASPKILSNVSKGSKPPSFGFGVGQTPPGSRGQPNPPRPPEITAAYHGPIDYPNRPGHTASGIRPPARSPARPQQAI